MNIFKKFGLLITVLVHLTCYSVARTCEEHQFQCDDGECIGMIGLCDGLKDCIDESDETKCNDENYPKCAKNYFQCVSDKHCIPTQWRCDYEDDCEDNSDEKNCHNEDYPKCREHNFQCVSDRHCIPIQWRCDNENDCDDNSDEENCHETLITCVGGTILCEKGNYCIPKAWLCDSIEDCDDGFDEKNCDNIPSASTIPATKFPGTTHLSCPENYCEQNADCIVIKDQYHCNCSPSFTGKKCESRITHDLGLVIGIATTLIALFIITALGLFCSYKRRTARNSTALISKTESQKHCISYSKE